TGPALLEAVLDTPILRYARTVARQSGHDLVGLRMSKPDETSTLGELMKFWEKGGPANIKARAVAAHAELLTRFGLDRSVMVGHHSATDTLPAPAGSRAPADIPKVAPPEPGHAVAPIEPAKPAALAPGETIEPRIRRSLETELRSLGHGDEVSGLSD